MKSVSVLTTTVSSVAPMITRPSFNPVVTSPSVINFAAIAAVTACPGVGSNASTSSVRSWGGKTSLGIRLVRISSSPSVHARLYPYAWWAATSRAATATGVGQL